jgi:hypothetical protein
VRLVGGGLAPVFEAGLRRAVHQGPGPSSVTLSCPSSVTLSCFQCSCPRGAHRCVAPHVLHQALPTLTPPLPLAAAYVSDCAFGCGCWAHSLELHVKLPVLEPGMLEPALLPARRFCDFPRVLFRAHAVTGRL